MTVRLWSDAGDKGGGWGGDSFFFNFMPGSGPAPSRSRENTNGLAAMDEDGAGSDLSSVLRKSYDDRVYAKEGGMASRISGIRSAAGGSVLRCVVVVSCYLLL